MRKLEYYRASGYDRHVRDAAMILRISSDMVDHEELDRWVEELGLQDQLSHAREYAPDR